LTTWATSALWIRSFGSSSKALRNSLRVDRFFDLLAQDVVFDFIITVPNYPRHIVGRDNLIELYRGYGSTLFLDRCYDVRVHPSPSTSSVVLEYSSEGRAVATGQPYSNRYISVVVIKDSKSHRVARLPRPTAGLRRPRGTPL
jgi:ketosteroid isomerase-like protein